METVIPPPPPYQIGSCLTPPNISLTPIPLVVSPHNNPHVPPPLTSLPGHLPHTNTPSHLTHKNLPGHISPTQTLPVISPTLIFLAISSSDNNNRFPNCFLQKYCYVLSKKIFIVQKNEIRNFSLRRLNIKNKSLLILALCRKITFFAKNIFLLRICGAFAKQIWKNRLTFSKDTSL